MNINNSLKNLEIIFEILDEMKVEYFIFFGTLLGIIRNKNLIEHDTDTDIFIKSISILQVNYLSERLSRLGFHKFRHTDEIISFERNKEYTDLYLFKKFDNYYKCIGFNIPESYLGKISTISAQGLIFKVPTNYKLCLDFLYGHNWETEIRQYNAKPGFYKYGRTNSYLLYFLAYSFPNLYLYLFKIKEKFRKSSPYFYKLLKKILERYF